MEDTIQKIKLDVENKQEKTQEAASGSILIPKLEPGKLRGRGILAGAKRAISSKTLRLLKIFAATLFVFLLVTGLLFYNVYKKAVRLQASANDLIASFNAKDLPRLKEEMVKTKISLSALSVSYKTVAWMKFVPLLGGYVADGGHAIAAALHAMDAGDVLISGIEPYADIIGFSGEDHKAGSGQETAEDRLDFVLKALPELSLRMDELVAKVNMIRDEVDNINPDRYPENIAGRKLREEIRKMLELTDMSADLLTRGKPLLASAPYLLGMDVPRRYLILFQNDKELRPTGGFMTAYSIAKVDKGNFETVASSDIYNLDAQYKPTVAAEEPLIKYLKGPYVLSKNLRLRDMNWSPDFETSMQLFTTESQKVGIKDIDGVIGVDTQTLVNILEVLGPIGVPGFGDFSTKIVAECNCPQVIYELESFADIEGPIVWSENEPGKIVYAPPNYDNRKKIIGPLMNSILANAMGQPKDKLPGLFEAVFKSFTEKHVLFFLSDEVAQSAVKSFGIAGKIEDFDGDYLHINDANLGGRKSNLYVTSEVNQEVSIAKDGSVEKTLNITYKNPEKYDGWLNSVLPNWMRVYVPKGSQLISFEGVEDKSEPYEEFDRTVFAGFFNLRPEGIAKVTLRYKLPFKVSGTYKLLIQKQSGTDRPLYILKVGREEQEFFLTTDKEIKLGI